MMISCNSGVTKTHLPRSASCFRIINSEVFENILSEQPPNPTHHILLLFYLSSENGLQSPPGLFLIVRPLRLGFEKSLPLVQQRLRLPCFAGKGLLAQLLRVERFLMYVCIAQIVRKNDLRQLVERCINAKCEVPPAIHLTTRNTYVSVY